MKLKLSVPLACQLDDKHNKWVMWALAGIIVLAVILRLLFFNVNPPALNQDEATTGYNAYSLGKTLKDYRGYFLPAQVHAFGNIGLTSPLYTYLAVPFVAVLGLNETATRLPALIFNILLLLVIFKVVLHFFDNPLLALLAAFLLSLNPWHFHYSRVSHEALLSPFFYTLIILLFYLAFTKERFLRYFISGGLVLGLSFYVYQIAFLLSPLIMLIMGLFYIRPALRRWYGMLLSLALCFVIIFPLLWTLVIHPDKTAESRFNDVTIIGKPDFAEHFLTNYFSHFSNSYLYFDGDIGDLPYSDGKYGVLHIYMSILLPLGVTYLIYHFFAERKYRRRILLALVFLLLYPLPAALTNPSPHALRSYTLFPFFHVIAAAGLWLLLKSIYDLVFRRLSSKLAVLIRGGLFSLCALPVLIIFGSFLIRYYFYYPKHPLNYLYYQYGIKEAVAFLVEHDKQTDQVYFTTHVNQPFIFVLYYTRFDPAKYQVIKKDGTMAYFGYVSHFDKYYFIEDQEMPAGKQRTLYVTEASTNLAGETLLKIIKDPRGEARYKIWGDQDILNKGTVQ